MFFPGMFKKSDAPVTTPAELAEAVGMTYDTYTGKRVSSQKAMRLTAVFGCIRVLADSMGMLPCNLYNVTGNSKQKATSERHHRFAGGYSHPDARNPAKSYADWWYERQPAV